MKFYTKYVRPKARPEMNDGVSITEKFEAVDIGKQVERMMAAGERLAAARAAQFDQTAEQAKAGEIPEPDPTRSPGFDMADASRIAREVENNLVKRAAEKKAAAEKAAKEAEEAERAAKKAAEGAYRGLQRILLGTARCAVPSVQKGPSRPFLGCTGVVEGLP